MAREHDHAGWARRAALRLRAARPLGMLRAWARSCPSNFEASFLIASAELAHTRGRAREATTLFERAIAAARTHGNVKREALASELLAAPRARPGTFRLPSVT